MKRILFVALLCAILAGFMSVWAGDSETELIGQDFNTSNYNAGRFTHVAENPLFAAKEGYTSSGNNDALRLDIEEIGDSCSNPFIISTFPYQDTRDNSTFNNCYDLTGSLTGPDVVYQFTITECKDVTISLCNSPNINLDLALLVFGDGNCGDTVIVSNDDGCVPDGWGTPTLTARLDAGTYYFILDSYPDQTGTYVLDVSVEDCPAPPPYDNCSDIDYDSLLVVNSSLTYEVNNAGASIDPDCDTLGTACSWIYFRTTELLDVTVEMCGTTPMRENYFIILSEYCPCQGLDFIFATESEDTSCVDGNGTLHFNRLAAGEYYFPVMAGAVEGDWMINVAAQPASGICDYTCSPGTTPENESCPTTPGDEDTYNGGCNSVTPVFLPVAGGQSYCGNLWAEDQYRDTDWYEYTPSQDTIITWGAVGSVPLAVIVLDITEGCDSTEYVRLGSDGAVECDLAYVTTFVQAGHRIALFVSTNGIYDGYPCALSADYNYEATLTCISTAPPANDNCADAIEIGDVTDYGWTNVGATTDNNQSCHADLQADVWYRYTPSCNGTAIVDLCNSGFDTYLGIFTDDCVNHECITLSDDDCGEGGGPSYAEFDVIAGEPVLLCLGGWQGSMGIGTFNVTCIPGPAIDVQPTAVAKTAPLGGNANEMLTVSNIGGQELIWINSARQTFPTTTVANNTNVSGIQRNPSEISSSNISKKYDVRGIIPSNGYSDRSDFVMQRENVHSAAPARQIGNKPAPGLTTEFCEILMTGDPAVALSGWFTGGELYAQYQDPELFCGAPVYPYLIDNIQFSMMLSGDATTAQYLHYQFVIYGADMTNPSCPVPDTAALLYVAPADSSLFNPGNHFYFRYNPSLVVDGPYFVAVNFYQYYGDPNYWRLITENNPPPDQCISYNDYGSGWVDLGTIFTDYGDLSNLWRSSGNTPTTCDVTCPTGGIAEAEACGDDLNGGCLLDPPAYEAISCNTTICGTSWADGGFRDTDWLQFTITDPTYMEIVIESEFPAEVYLWEIIDCDTLTYEYADVMVNTCEPRTIFGNLNPGTYTVVVVPNSFENVLCDGTGLFGNEYYVSLQCMPSWLSVDTDQGICPPDVQVNVMMDATYLTEAVYEGTVTFYSTDALNPEVIIPVTFTVSDNPGYQYLPGDANMAAGLWRPTVVGGDVTYLVNFFRGLVSDCKLDGFYASADINASCSVTGGDVTRLVNYFRGMNGIDYCPDYEPVWHNASEVPTDAPSGWPNCE